MAQAPSGDDHNPSALHSGALTVFGWAGGGPPGRLVAVAVLDVLPRCLSSVYFFWDPALAPLALGKLSALRELAWVADAARARPALHWYYMGYYIHACPKVRGPGAGCAHPLHRMRWCAVWASTSVLAPRWEAVVRVVHSLQRMRARGVAVVSDG